MSDNELKARVLRNELAIIIGCQDGRSAVEKAEAVIWWMNRNDGLATIQPTAASERAPSRDSIDTAEFRKLSYAYAEALFKGTVPATQAAWGAVVAHIDARRAQPKGLSIALEEVTAKLGREAAENISLNMENIDLREQLARRTSTADAVRDARNDFERGYFCAVAVALREDGPVTTVRSMFSQGGDANKADPFDIDLFVEHGLMKSIPKEPA
jgi:hypothetical protein